MAVTGAREAIGELLSALCAAMLQGLLDRLVLLCNMVFRDAVRGLVQSPGLDPEDAGFLHQWQDIQEQLSGS
jgi:hypothetical protein